MLQEDNPCKFNPVVPIKLMVIINVFPNEGKIKFLKKTK